MDAAAWFCSHRKIKETQIGWTIVIFRKLVKYGFNFSEYTGNVT